jgi:hypothetical protein
MSRERRGQPASMDYCCPLWWVAPFSLHGILWEMKWTIKWMVTAQEWRRKGRSGQQYWWPQSIFNWWPAGDGLVSYWWESNAEGRSNSFASGWMFRLFEEAILGALCGSQGRWIWTNLVPRKRKDNASEKKEWSVDCSWVRRKGKRLHDGLQFHLLRGVIRFQNLVFGFSKTKQNPLYHK